MQKRICFDVGARDGERSLHLASASEWEVYAFEPKPRRCDYLRERSRGARNYHVFQLAVADKPSVIMLDSAGHHEPDTRLLSQKDSAAFVEAEIVHANAITLRDFVIGHGIERIDVLHSNADGMDLEVLVGLGEKISIVQSGRMTVARSKQSQMIERTRCEWENVVLFLYQYGLQIAAIHAGDSRGRLMGELVPLVQADRLVVDYVRANNVCGVLP